MIKGGLLMETVLMIVSILLIAIVLVQSAKAESAEGVIQGGNSELFNVRKERGAELVISRLTYILGAIFFILCVIMGF